MTPAKERVEAISDGIFVFAAILVVVSLDVPHTLGELRPNVSRPGSFAVSFAALTLR